VSDEASYDELIVIARESIRSGVCVGRSLQVDPDAFLAPLREWRASFVTLRLGGDLRGCIGALEPIRPLVADVAENAFAAAFRDPRFPPVSLVEAERLEVHVSVLSPLETLRARSKADLLAQLRPGVDGLVLELGPRRATFLPSVWSQLPDPPTFVAALLQKAGLAAAFWSPEMRAQRYAVTEIPRAQRAG
jgi:AmmeMemoRadiSam system protein A